MKIVYDNIDYDITDWLHSKEIEDLIDSFENKIAGGRYQLTDIITFKGNPCGDINRPRVLTKEEIDAIENEKRNRIKQRIADEKAEIEAKLKEVEAFEKQLKMLEESR